MKTLILLLTACSVGMASIARAHPVAQGALSVEVSTNAIHVRVRVSTEEAFVANSFATGSAKATSLSAVWQKHGDYLRQHIRIFANGIRLNATPAKVDALENNFLTYHIEFAMAAAPTPTRILIEEDVLNEIEFAPGNPWEATYVVNVSQTDRVSQEGLLLSRAQPLEIICDWQNVSKVSTPSLNVRNMVCQYVRAGVGHILTGYDHLLFVCALVLTAMTLIDLIKVISAFTLAHTITLVLSVLNIVRLPSHIVEPMIAGSIVFVALMNLVAPKRSRGNLRVATAFFFGLFHGLGFAGGLLDAMNGLNGVAVGIAITAFSLGVEIGHQMVVLPVFFGLKWARTTQSTQERRDLLALAVTRVGSALISIAGTMYLVAALRA